MNMEEIDQQVIENCEDDGETKVARWSRPDYAEDRFPKENLGNYTKLCIALWIANITIVHCFHVVFHWFDIDMTSGDPLNRNPAGGDIVGSKEGPVPIIKLYGVTDDGLSVLAYIHGFTPYFYVSLPASTDLSDNSLGLLRVSLDQRVSPRIPVALHFTSAKLLVYVPSSFVRVVKRESQGG